MSAADLLVAPLAGAALFALFGLLRPVKECSGDCRSCTGAGGSCSSAAPSDRSTASPDARHTARGAGGGRL